MTRDSLEILWRGADPAKFTALQAALRDEGIRFWHLLAHDHAGGFLNSRPYYIEAMPGFEIRVASADIDSARVILNTIEARAALPDQQSSSAADAGERGAPAPVLPIDWDPGEATYEVWSGEDEAAAEYIFRALAENGVPCRMPDDASLRLRICVRPADSERAKDIVREIKG